MDAMGRSFWNWTLAVVRRAAFAESTRAGGLAALCASVVLIVVHQALWTVGTSSPPQSAIHLAILAGVLLGLRLPGRAALAGPRLVALAALLLGASWLPGVWNAVLAIPGLSSVEGPLWNSLTTFFVGLPLVTVPTALATGAIAQDLRPRTLAGIGCGILATVLGSSMIGVELWAVVLAAPLLTIGLQLWLHGSSQATSQADPVSLPRAETVARVVLAVGIGGLAVAMHRIAHQWSVTSTPAQWLETAVAVFGVTAGALWSQRRGASRPTPYLLAGLLGVGGVLLCLAAFPAGVRTSLWLNACVDQPLLLSVTRALLAGVGYFPLGVAFGAVFLRQPRPSGEVLPVGVALAVGACIAESGIASLGTTDQPVVVVSLGLGALTLAGALAGVGGGAAWRERLARQMPNRAGRVAVAGLLTLVLVSSVFASAYDPSLAAKTLFSTRVFVAYRHGLKGAWLTHLDDGRAVRTVEGDQGTLTLFKHGGHQLHIRENGIPRGILSLDPELHPQFSAEVLQAVFPLILHEQPASVLVLGSGSGVNFTTALEFPIRRCVCAEGNAGLRRVVAELHRDQALADDRMRIWPVDAPTALRGSPEVFDVIVSNPGQPSLAATQPLLTPEFYRLAAARLSDQGIFCQWLQCIDIGPDPVRTVVQSARQAFPEVMAVEIAHRDFLILGSRHTLVREGLYERAQTPQVRRTLSHVGLDWCVLLDLPASRTEDLVAFSNGASGWTASLTAQPSRLPFSLPVEVMRWAPKQEELQAALATHTGRLANWIPEAESPFLLRRLSEVAGQQKLKTQLSNQYWAYRQSLREEVSTRPASMIQQTSGGGDGMHEEDRRRIAYFKVLAKAVKTRDTADIERLVAFGEPYDPLLSDFVHFEAAALHAKAENRDVARELRHRLHCVFYASPVDTSVHSVVAALRLVNAHAEAEPDPSTRWDVCNALLQALQTRWEARAGVPPRGTTTEILRDIDSSLSAAEVTMAAMPRITADAGLPSETWTLRKLVLERALLAPVQAYRKQVQQKHREIPVLE